MIEKDSNNVTAFKEKVVFAPNGFGKTQFSLYLKDFYENEGYKVALFTDRVIDSLVKYDSETIYIGTAANDFKNRDRIYSELRNQKTIEGIIKNESLNKTTYKNSFFGNYIPGRTIDGKSFLEALKSINVVNSFIDDKYNTKDLFSLNILLDKKIFDKAVALIDGLSDFVDDVSDKIIISEDKKKYLNILKEYVSLNHLDECPLCGTKYENEQSLIDDINTKLSSYITGDQNDYSMKVKQLCEEIMASMNGSAVVTDFFKHKNLKTTNYIETMKSFVFLCSFFINNYVNYLLNVPVKDGKTLGNYLDDYTKSENNISRARGEIQSNNPISEFIKDELVKIISLKDEVEIKSSSDGFAVNVSINGKIQKDIQSILSTSEVKRLALVVLKAYVSILKYDYLILDDPIDSYDDYYLDVACGYIADLLKNNCNGNWYLLTNNTTCLSNITSALQCKALIFNDNPNLIFDDSLSLDDTISFEVQDDEVNIINRNELLLMAKYLNKNLKIDGLHSSFFSSEKLPFLSFIVTLRNFYDVVDKNYDFVCFYPNYKDDKNKKIEHCFMHFDDMPVLGHRKSGSLLMDEIYDIYQNLITITNPDVLVFNTPAVCINERKTCLLVDFNSFTGSKFLNLILYKILAISELKYEFEEAFITKLCKDYGISKIDKKTIIGEYCLYNKIDMADNICNSTYPAAINFMKRVKNAFSLYRNIINSFDHGLNQMFPPYLSISIRDMKKLRLEIEGIRNYT